MTTQPVTAIELGWSNSALRMPYALARLACGHLVGIEVKPNRGECTKCGRPAVQSGHTFPPCECGSISFYVRFHPDPHKDEDRVTHVGDLRSCEACEREVQQMAWLRSLPKDAVHHARFDPRFSPGSYHLYRYDPTSPSGFFLMGSVPATPKFDAVLEEIRVSPLSPTERA